MQKEVPIDWSLDTRDKGDHLNQTGAEKVTRFMGGYLAGTGLLKNHTGDSRYAKWDEVSDRFAAIVSSSR